MSRGSSLAVLVDFWLHSSGWNFSIIFLDIHMNDRSPTPDLLLLTHAILGQIRFHHKLHFFELCRTFSPIAMFCSCAHWNQWPLLFYLALFLRFLMAIRTQHLLILLNWFSSIASGQMAFLSTQQMPLSYWGKAMEDDSVALLSFVKIHGK